MLLHVHVFLLVHLSELLLAHFLNGIEGVRIHFADLEDLRKISVPYNLKVREVLDCLLTLRLSFSFLLFAPVR